MVDRREMVATAVMVAQMESVPMVPWETREVLVEMQWVAVFMLAVARSLFFLLLLQQISHKGAKALRLV